MLLERLAEELDPNEYDEMTSSRESGAEYDIDRDDFGNFGVTRAVSRACPECGSRGRLIGQIDVSHEVEVEYEQIGEEEFAAYATNDYYVTEMTPLALPATFANWSFTGSRS